MRHPQFVLPLLLTTIFCCAAIAKPPALPKTGDYQCRIGKGYKYRACQIHQSRGGGLMLTTTEGLITLEGHLHAVKGGLFFEGNFKGPRSFGCHSCAERCSKPGAKCGCKEIPAAGLRACMAQPLSAILKKAGRRWSGTIAQRIYSVIYEPLKKGQKPVDRAVVGYKYAIDLHSIDIKK